MNLDRVIAVRNTRTVYRDGSRCIKVFNEGHPKSTVLHEALNLARIEETGIHAPRLIEVCAIDGKWALVYEFIQGHTLEELMEKNPEKKAEYLECFVDIQLEIQNHTCPMLNQLKEKLQRNISLSQLDATTRYELHAQLEKLPTHNKVCHGDFIPSNVVISDSNVPYVIDWAHVTQGNASADAARTYLLFLLNEHIDDAEAYLNLFCRKSDTARQYVQKWMPIVAASQSVKGNAKEREFLLNWVNAVQYDL